jgi:pimeloyl-ACP methyl ester carboxylesterase
MSVPHPGAFLKALATSRQFFASWYVFFFQLPRVPEWYWGRDDWKGMSNFMQSRAEQPAEVAERDAQAMAKSGALTSALNWYRAFPLTDIRPALRKTTVPTMFVWSDRDKALLEKGARDTGDYVSGEYRFEILRGTHWMLDEQPDAVADLLIGWLAAHPV